MMKEITIFQDNTTPLTIKDVDDTSIEEYSRTLSNLLQNNNVSILYTSSCSVVIRPNKISSIVVSKVESPAQQQQQKKKSKSSPKKIEEHEDIIHD